MIKAVLFDVDGVLLDSFEANLQFYQNLMREAGYQPPMRKQFLPLFHLPIKDAIKKLTGISAEAEIEKIWKLGESRAVEYPLELLTMPKDADKVIKELSTKYKLAIVTSRVASSVYEFPDLAKLKKYFSVAIAYEDTANHKPHPEPLLLAVKKLRVAPSEAVYIGDVENDVRAARAAGMKIILYATKSVGEPDALTSSFPELLSVIEKL